LIDSPSTRAADPSREENRDAILMRAKLAASQQTLEGLMYGEFDLIDRGARQLRDIDEWHTTKRDAVYDHYSAEFHRLSEKLVRLAKEGRTLPPARITAPPLKHAESQRSE
jgi:hypothetical protein